MTAAEITEMTADAPLVERRDHRLGECLSISSGRQAETREPGTEHGRRRVASLRPVLVAHKDLDELGVRHGLEPRP